MTPILRNNSVATVLVSHMSLPNKEITSWGKRYTNLVKVESNPYDYVMSPRPSVDGLQDGVKAQFIDCHPRFLKSLTRRFKTLKYWKYRQTLCNILKKYDRVFISVIDNVEMLFFINDYLVKKGQRNKCVLHFTICGHSYFYSSKQGYDFYSCIDELSFLTETSYLFEVARNHTIPCEVSIIPNGIDSQAFCPTSPEENERHKNALNIQGKVVFMWCSQDRPKKGLHVILRAWQESVADKEDAVLLIFGTHNPPENIPENVKWIGRVPNEELPQYYRLSEVYLFSTLCHEGLPLSLVEAMKCGCHCLASNIDPVPEVLRFGEYGELVNNPHVVENWVNAIDSAYQHYKAGGSNPFVAKIPEDLYDLKTWEVMQRELINKWRRCLSNSATK